MHWTLAVTSVASIALSVGALPSKIEKRDWTVGQEVKTTSGTVKGHAGQFRKEVSEYVGIPYAKPPVGALRFAPPVKYVGTGSINASTYSPDCAATFQDPALAAGLEDANPGGILFLTEMMQLGHSPSEDCLTINIWTKPQTGEKAKAVMFWIYGGGFATGNSNNKIYDGQYMAENQDVVVVSFNYRLNIFGFPGVPGDSSVAQNAGFLDQRMALEWVRDNIAAFGGDPKRIVMFGESAGGASTDFYSYAYPDDPIISGAIAESGAVTSFADPQPPNNLKYWNDAAKKLSCPTEPVTESVKCLRTKSTEDILKATKIDNPLQAVLGHFGPSVDNKVVFPDYAARAAAGKFIQKPYMNGNNHFEAGLFVLIAGAAGIKIPSNVWSVFNAAVFTCPISDAATARSKKGLLNFRYRYFGDWANTNLQPRSGAYHTAEIPMIFGTSEESTSAPNEPQQTKVSDFMQKVWTQFAKDPTALTKAPFNLPRYNPETAFTDNTLIGFGANNLTAQMLLPSDYDLYCATIANIMKTLPAGIVGAIANVSEGKDMGVPGLKTEELPDMTPPELGPAPAGAV